MRQKAKRVIEKYDELESELGRPEIASDPSAFNKLNKQFQDIRLARDTSIEYLAKSADRDEWRSALESNDSELSEAAKAELKVLDEELPALEKKLQLLLVPKNPWDTRSAYLEIRAGTGGDESSLFAGDLLRMYRGFAQRLGWRFTVEEASEGTVGGYKDIRILLEGSDVFGILRWESGVHRVQRVPATESQGRVHTSAATVAVLPMAEEVDIQVRDSDLKVDTYRASGSGGQYINKTDSAIRITHMPTGVVVSCQQERSQIQNRLKAMEMLRGKLLDAAIAEREAKEAASRKSQVGTGDRSAKIRTYNYPQNRVTDHRIELTLYRLESFMAGDIAEMIDALRMADAQERLSQSEGAL